MTQQTEAVTHGPPHTVDRPPPDWFVLDVMRTKAHKWDWVALMIDVPIDDFIAWKGPSEKTVWVRIPGKHRNKDAACDALENLMATRH